MVCHLLPFIKVGQYISCSKDSEGKKQKVY